MIGRPRTTLSRRQLLGGGALAALALGLGARVARASGPSRLLVLWSAGGWDPTFVFDPHEAEGFGDPEATVATLGGLRVADAESRPSVRRFFQRYGDRAIIVNGVSVGSISHEGCTRLMLTGARELAQPDLATALAASSGAALALPHVVLSGPRYPGDLGASVVALSGTLAGIAGGSLPEGLDVDADAEARIRAYLSEEAERLGADRAAIAGALEGLERLPTLEAAVAALNIPDDPTDDTRLALVPRVLASGLCRSLTVQVGLPNQCTWDSHHENRDNQDRAFEHLFDALNDLVDTLSDTDGGAGQSLLDQTLVLVMSEMGRAPLLNAADGKDHWPVTSALLLGGDLVGGRTLGGTDEAQRAAPIILSTGEPDEAGERLSPAHLAAGILARFDVDPAPYFPGITPLSALDPA